MKVVTKTGLVPVFEHRTGRIRGVKPNVARQLIAERKGEFARIPAGIETYEEPDVIVQPLTKAAKPLEIEIPENWESEHYLRQIKLAQKIFGYDNPPEGRGPKEYAQELLREEVQRRAAAETPPA